MYKPRTLAARKPGDAATEEQRYEYVLSAAAELFRFYQAEVLKYSYTYSALTILTLIGTATTPLLALLLPAGQPHANFFIALPSGIAGLAAALNSAFRLKDEWAHSYFTLSAIDNERDRFIVRASPDYAADRPLTEAIDNFQNRISTLVMSEVTLWRQEMARATSQAQSKQNPA